MWLLKVFGVIYFTALSAQESAASAVFTSDSPPTSPMPESTTVYVPPVPSLQLQSGWLDVFPSEKVEFTCSISGISDWTINWYRNGEKIQDDSNLILSQERSVLTVTAGTHYSGNYSCGGVHKIKAVSTQHSKSLDVRVYESPNPTLSKSPNYDRMFSGESVVFTCKISVSSGWEYVWYHNEKEIPFTENTYNIGPLDHSHSGQYHCRARRGKELFNTQKTVISLQIADPPKPILKLLSPWSDVFKSERVEFSCDVGSSDWRFTWYKNEKELREHLEADGSFLKITSVSQKDKGLYACKAHHKSRNVTSGYSNTTNITVYDNTPVPTLRKSYGFDVMYVGETVNFTCTVDVSSGWQYQWYKDKHPLPHNTKTISIPLKLSEKGNYLCKATRGGTTLTDFSEAIPQNVLEIPVPSSRLITQWSDVFPTESVKLSCGMEGRSDWKYTWYRKEQEIRVDSAVSFDVNRATLSISSASAKHAGQYKCKGHLKDRSVRSSLSSGLTLTVYDKKPSVILTQDPEYKVMFAGESVTFSCYINVSSGWNYLWKKDGILLSELSNIYSKSPIGITDEGSYECRAKRGRDQPFYTNFSAVTVLEVQEEKPKALMTQQPDVDMVYTGESVSFECKVKISSGWDYHWFKNGSAVLNYVSRFYIHNATVMDAGKYTCIATRNKTKYNTEKSDERLLRVSEIPVPTLKKGSRWLDVFLTESVTLSCGMPSRSEWTYTWSKDGREIHADTDVSFDSDKTTLSIRSASHSHRGRYSCKGKLKTRSVSSGFSSELTLKVYDTKPRVILTQTPEHKLMHTGDSVSFACHIIVSTGWEYQWYKDDRGIVSGYNHTIGSVVTTDSGSYQCQVKRGKDFESEKSSALALRVEERPQAHITLLTGWSEVFSTDTLVLKCGISENQYTWNYTWFKEGQPMNLQHSEKLTVTPQDDPEQSLYTCQGIRTERPSYSRTSDSLKTKNLLLKRRVLLSISGCIFFGIIAVFLGCIVLRVMRKPAHVVDQPDESNLFLTMAQLKDRADAPCPLVDYITDEALNAPAEEVEENGTICNETTPLPITTPEDQAVKTENHDKEESNGGLISFKQ